VRFLAGALGEGKLPRSHFDRAALATVLGEIPDPRGASRIHSALKPGGLLLVKEVMGDPDYQPVRTVRALTDEAPFHTAALSGDWLSFFVTLHRPPDAQ
jgi:hypothetical protein